MKLAIGQIRVDGNTQSRADFHEDTAHEYAERMKAGDEFPPPVVFSDGAAYWLADGFHRVEAHRLADHKTVECEVREGGPRDALLWSLTANAKHGIRRTNADKRKAVETLLRDPEWAKWSDRRIAEQAGVGNRFVGDVRRDLAPPSGVSGTQQRRKGSDGKSYSPTRKGSGGKKRKPAKPPVRVVRDEEPPPDDEPEPHWQGPFNMSETNSEEREMSPPPNPAPTPIAMRKVVCPTCGGCGWLIERSHDGNESTEAGRSSVGGGAQAASEGRGDAHHAADRGVVEGAAVSAPAAAE